MYGVQWPRPSDGKRSTRFEWCHIRYRNVIGVLKHPFYAGAYASGKSEKRTALVDGHPRRSYGHGKPLEQWEVLIKDHHAPRIFRRPGAHPAPRPAPASGSSVR